MKWFVFLQTKRDRHRVSSNKNTVIASACHPVQIFGSKKLHERFTTVVTVFQMVIISINRLALKPANGITASAKEPELDLLKFNPNLGALS